ncbi:DUF4173 domain-containing protein [Patescibacteria group bacterium]|nr:DUF4173 domain-containing protein [Patescibacteria group bacterium]
MINIKFYKKSDKILRAKLLLSIVPAFFWVISLWNFWDKGIYALGFNATIFGLLLLALFIWVLYEKGYYIKNDLLWIMPMFLIFLSYSIYDNPFLKITSLLFTPIMLGIFYNQAFLKDKKTKNWDFEFISKIISRFFSFLIKINQSARLYLNLIIPSGKTKKNTAARIIGGVVLFLIIAFTVFIPLLSAADAVFAGQVQVIYDWFLNIFSSVLVYKVLVVIVLTVLLFSVLSAWGRKFEYQEKESANKNIDPIISGIFIGGVLCLYLLFLVIQVNRLWVGGLPFDFKAVETLVKSGFWQLLLLSMINILIYFFSYRKTSLLVQRILSAFTITSLLLLVSAAYRMALYVIYYGFSYEKFFASYTVLFCAVLFVWLIAKLFSRKRANILKFLIILFLWMYALMTVFPVEHFILRTNIALSNIKESRIRLLEMTMLSSDALSLVKKYERQGLLKESSGYLSRESTVNGYNHFDWSPWIKKQEKIISDKTWYEKNIMNIIYLNSSD